MREGHLTWTQTARSTAVSICRLVLPWMPLLVSFYSLLLLTHVLRFYSSSRYLPLYPEACFFFFTRTHSIGLDCSWRTLPPMLDHSAFLFANYTLINDIPIHCLNIIRFHEKDLHNFLIFSPFLLLLDSISASSRSVVGADIAFIIISFHKREYLDFTLPLLQFFTVFVQSSQL